jgi:hypothetical protein
VEACRRGARLRRRSWRAVEAVEKQLSVASCQLSAKARSEQQVLRLHVRPIRKERGSKKTMANAPLTMALLV